MPAACCHSKRPRARESALKEAEQQRIIVQNHIRQLAISGLAVALVLAVILAGFAIYQWRRAEALQKVAQNRQDGAGVYCQRERLRPDRPVRAGH